MVSIYVRTNVHAAGRRGGVGRPLHGAYLILRRRLIVQSHMGLGKQLRIMVYYYGGRRSTIHTRTDS